MAEPRDLRNRIEDLIERAQHEMLDASHQLASGITKETDRFVPPFSQDIERVVDEVFDFAERVMHGQRKMVNDLVRTINEQSQRAKEAGRSATQRVAEHTPGRKSRAKRKAAAKKSAPKKSAPKKSAPKKSAAKKAASKKAASKKAAPKKAAARKSAAKKPAKATKKAAKKVAKG